MTKIPVDSAQVSIDAPLTNFSLCHQGIVLQLGQFAELPALMEPVVRARKVATDTIAFFSGPVLEHHQDEERDLFPAVLKSAAAGEERDRVQAMVERLTHEHRRVEAAWKRLEPTLKDIAHGKPAQLDAEAVQELVRSYAAHAQFEELDFLPLSETILGRNGNHMAALGLSLHLRHAPVPIGYI